MIGAIIGDIAGSRFEGPRRHPKRKNFTLFANQTHFTDDTVLSVATADAILFDRHYRDVYKEYFARYPHAGYGSSFKTWAKSKSKEGYDSWGNGSAMRISPVAWAFNYETTVLEEARKSAEVSHNHPEGIKGAQAVALAIYMARNGRKKYEINAEITKQFGYDLNPPVLPFGKFDVSCQGSVPQAFAAFFDSEDFADTIRKAIFRGGDSDTIAAIAGSIAEAYYGIPPHMIECVFDKLPEDLANITTLFTTTYVDKNFVRPAKSNSAWRKWFDILLK